MTSAVRLGHVIVPADDLEPMVVFYRDVVGLQVRFQDGDRYAALSDGSVTLGLASGEEQPAAGRVTLSVEVEDVDRISEQLGSLGLDIGSPVSGPHERRVLALDPMGNPLVFYERFR